MKKQFPIRIVNLAMCMLINVKGDNNIQKDKNKMKL
jgi:hypothetical protein